MLLRFLSVLGSKPLQHGIKSVPGGAPGCPGGAHGGSAGPGAGSGGPSWSSETVFGTDVRIFKRLVSASMKSYRPHLLTQASYGPELHFAKF